jgi:hypothetical protein
VYSKRKYCGREYGLLKNYVGKHKYVCHLLSQQPVYAHRLVAEAFVDNPNNLPEINHINGIKHDNRAENLEWCTRSANILHAISTGLRGPSKYHEPKLTPRQVRAIMTIGNRLTYKEIASIYNVSEKVIKDIYWGHTWNHITNLPRTRKYTPKTKAA